MFVDLHNHSTYSDGSMSPQEILKYAKEANVSVLAITDHDVLEGSKELLRLNDNDKIHVISGVEIDALEGKDNIHILGYGVDLYDDLFAKRIKENRARLDKISLILFDRMEKDGRPVSVAEYESSTYNLVHGGWKALYYMVDKGIIKNIWEGFDVYSAYNCGSEIAEYPSVREVAAWIHEAGGIAILAHPGVSIWKDSMTYPEFRKKLEEMIAMGLDGIECYYPKHSDEITRISLDVCKEHCLSVTSGSDCHGEFQKAKMGELRIAMDFLQLPDCLFREY